MVIFSKNMTTGAYYIMCCTIGSTPHIYLRKAIHTHDSINIKCHKIKNSFLNTHLSKGYTVYYKLKNDILSQLQLYFD